MKNLKYIIIIFTIFFISLVGCGDNSKEYDEFVQKFDLTYFELAKSVDITDTMKTLGNMQDEKNSQYISELKKLLDDIRDKVSQKEKEHFEVLQSRYKGLVLIKESYAKWDKMTPDEKGKVLAEISYIEMRKKDKT